MDLQLSINFECETTPARDSHRQRDWNDTSLVSHCREDEFWKQTLRHQRGPSHTDAPEHDQRGLQSPNGQSEICSRRKRGCMEVSNSVHHYLP